MNNELFVLDASHRREVIDRLTSKIGKHYLFAEVAHDLVRTLQTNLDTGVYDAIASGAEFAAVLTEDVRTISHDRHMWVSYSQEAQPEPSETDESSRRGPSEEEKEQWRVAETVRNFGFERIERLPGNIGYLDLRGFAEASWAAEAAHMIMNILSETYALIIDLRQNRGGWPSMVHLLTSYFFADEIYLGTYQSREDDEVRQLYTFPYLSGSKYIDKPVYLLTSAQTFSAAESFARHLRTQKRATLIGETTGGGLYIGRPFFLTPHFHAWISTGGSQQPMSADEEPGLVPDIAVAQDQAFDIAHIEALKAVLAQLGEQPYGALIGLKEEAETALQTLQ